MVSMTINQYLELERGNVTLKEIKKSNLNKREMEVVAGEILRSERLTTMFNLTVASLNILKKNVFASTTEAIAKINNAGFSLLGLLQTLGYWGCIIGCIIEILKSLINGDSKGVGKIIMKYVVIFGSFYLLPFIFDLIKSIFG